MNELKFINNNEFNNSAKAFIAILPFGINNKNELLDELKKKLMFPEYFGFNWDALSDCLKDFHWIKEKK